MIDDRKSKGRSGATSTTTWEFRVLSDRPIWACFVGCAVLVLLLWASVAVAACSSVSDDLTSIETLHVDAKMASYPNVSAVGQVKNSCNAGCPVTLEEIGRAHV